MRCTGLVGRWQRVRAAVSLRSLRRTSPGRGAAPDAEPDTASRTAGDAPTPATGRVATVAGRLRGLPIDAMRRNLAWMIGASHGAGADVLLVGMQMPPNLGPEYTREFAASFPLLATRFDTALVPFLLEPIAAARDNFQDDNLHPVADAQDALRDHVWSGLAPLLDR